MRLVFGIGASFLLASAVAAFAQDAFVPACPLPFAGAQKRPVDRTCPPEGQPSTPAHADEYRAKNNVCAPEPVVDVTLADVLAMQQVAANIPGVPIGARNQPVPDRAVLKGIFTTQDGKRIGEGDRVRLVAFLVAAKPTGGCHSDG